MKKLFYNAFYSFLITLVFCIIFSFLFEVFSSLFENKNANESTKESLDNYFICIEKKHREEFCEKECNQAYQNLLKLDAEDKLRHQ